MRVSLPTAKAGRSRRTIARASWIMAASILTLMLGPSLPGANAAFPGGNGLIAFQSDRGDGGSKIFAMHPDGSGVHRLTPSDKVSENPAFSPSGHRIAFTRMNSDFHLDIFVMRANGTDEHRLTRRPHDEIQPIYERVTPHMTHAKIATKVTGSVERAVVWIRQVIRHASTRCKAIAIE